jgi:hypothetical protein
MYKLCTTTKRSTLRFAWLFGCATLLTSWPQIAIYLNDKYELVSSALVFDMDSWLDAACSH